MRIAVSGAHITPALAVIDATADFVIKKGESFDVVFFGRKHSMEGDPTLSVEYQTIKDRGFKFIEVNAGRLQRQFTKYTIPALFKIPLGFFQCFAGLLKTRPDVIVSMGGYISVPLVVAGRILGIPIITHEQTAVAGLASKVDAFFADRIAVSFAGSVSKFPKSKVVLTGNPIRSEIFNEKVPNPYGFSNDLPVLYITGGNQGSHVINIAVSQVLEKILTEFNVVHQCGDSKFDDFGKLLHQSLNLSEELRNRYILTKYIKSNEIGSVLATCDIVVGRSGANTVTELAVLGKPSILIPIPYASHNEQEENAKLLVNAGTARILFEKELSGDRLIEEIKSMSNDLQLFRANAEKAKSIVKRDADLRLAEEIYALYQKKKNS